jgi:hypothetical protein
MGGLVPHWASEFMCISAHFVRYGSFRILSWRFRDGETTMKSPTIRDS